MFLDIHNENPKTYTSITKSVFTLFDWRTYNVISEVKHQGNCASSYAFSAVRLF